MRRIIPHVDDNEEHIDDGLIDGIASDDGSGGGSNANKPRFTLQQQQQKQRQQQQTTSGGFCNHCVNNNNNRSSCSFCCYCCCCYKYWFRCSRQQRFMSCIILLLVACVLREIYINADITVSSSSSLTTTTTTRTTRSNNNSSSMMWQNKVVNKSTRIVQRIWHNTRMIRIRPDIIHYSVNNISNNHNRSSSTDDVIKKKSCAYKRRRWYCQECQQIHKNHGKQQQQQLKCIKLYPRGKCPPFVRTEYPVAVAPRWDTISSSSLSSLSTTSPTTTGGLIQMTMVPTRTLYHLQRYRYEEQPLCTVATCFNLNQCRADGVLTVYFNNSSTNRNKQRLRDLQHSLELLDYAINSINNNNNNSKNSSSFSRRILLRLERVEHHQDACLIVVMRGMYDSVQDLKSSAAWNSQKHKVIAGDDDATSSGAGEGQNHFLWQVNRLGFQQTTSSSSSSLPLQRFTADMPFSSWHVGLAAVASEALTLATWRPWYDISLPLSRQWHRPISPNNVDIHRPRSLLVSFKGGIQNTRHVYYQHRWLAAEYWSTQTTTTQQQQNGQRLDSSNNTTSSSSNNYDDIRINVQCQSVNKWTHKKMIAQPYDENDDSNDNKEYSDMMWNSTFGFAPGGSGAGSYRFGEILSTGGIPVLVGPNDQQWVPPLYPEESTSLLQEVAGNNNNNNSDSTSTWNKCIVFVNERHLIDLPRILRRMSAHEIHQRQFHCWNLFQNIIGDVKDNNNNNKNADSSSSSWREDVRVTFTRVMGIWALRIAHAMEYE